MARAATAGELTKFRSSNQAATLYLAIHKPSTVLACQVAQTFPDGNDQVSQISYDAVTSGAYGNVLEGMTMYIGSAAGLWDLGQARVISATATTIKINSVSDIPWADNLYLTIVDEIGLWPRNIVQVGEALLMDGTTGYGDQHANMTPVPVLGPLANVYWLDGATVTHSPTAADSWALGGAAVSGYSWTAPGASATANLATATPTITYNAVSGATAYRVGCTLTADNAKTDVAYRRVFVFNRTNSKPIEQFAVSSLEGQYGGGYTLDLELYDQAAIADVRDRALVVLFAEEWYGAVKGSIGPVTGAENILFAGWIDGETISIDPDKSSARFTVMGPAGWLDKITVDSLTLLNVDSAPTTWNEIQDLTVDKAYYHMIRWRSTASMCMDCYKSGDTHELPVETQLSGGLFAQIASCGSKIFATPSVDHLGRMFLEVDTQMLPVASRDTIPTVMALTKDDFSDLRIERRATPGVSKIEVSSVVTDDVVLMSLAPGVIPSRAGSVERYDELLVTDQAELNVLSGLAYARANNAYPNVDIDMIANNRLIGICPLQRVTISLIAGDTLRGIVWTDKIFLPRRISYQFGEGGVITTALTLEAETSGAAGITKIPSQAPLENTPDTPSDYEPIDPIDSGTGNVPDVIPRPPDVEPAGCTDDAALPNGPFQVFPSLDVLVSNVAEKRSVDIPFPCTLRPGTAVNKSRLSLATSFQRWTGTAWETLFGDGYGNVTVEAIDANGTVLLAGGVTAVGGSTDAFFSPAGALGIHGFRVSIADTDLFLIGTYLGANHAAANIGHGIFAAPGADQPTCRMYVLETTHLWRTIGGAWTSDIYWNWIGHMIGAPGYLRTVISGDYYIYWFNKNEDAGPVNIYPTDLSYNCEGEFGAKLYFGEQIASAWRMAIGFAHVFNVCPA